MSDADATPEPKSDSDGTPGQRKRILLVPDGVFRSRLVICDKCEHFSRITRLCAVCHCVMPFKARLAGARCPEGKWRHFVPPPKPWSDS
jgi:hypothetical protein